MRAIQLRIGCAKGCVGRPVSHEATRALAHLGDARSSPFFGGIERAVTRMDRGRCGVVAINQHTTAQKRHSAFAQVHNGGVLLASKDNTRKHEHKQNARSSARSPIGSFPPADSDCLLFTLLSSLSCLAIATLTPRSWTCRAARPTPPCRARCSARQWRAMRRAAARTTDARPAPVNHPAPPSTAQQTQRCVRARQMRRKKKRAHLSPCAAHQIGNRRRRALANRRPLGLVRGDNQRPVKHRSKRDEQTDIFSFHSFIASYVSPQNRML